MACMASAAAAAPAAADTSAVPAVPVTLPTESIETALPVQVPSLRTGVPVPVPGVPDGPRHVTGRLLPARALPAVPLAGQLPETLLELPVENPLGEGNLAVASAATEASETKLRGPGADLDAPLSPPRPSMLGLTALQLPAAGLDAPVLRSNPVGNLLVR
ncbi:hypothetical protein [Streptomyces sp. PR69]|uniref:hypothetical protein n=1 Tax=Streptomyces sp. PR69 TaxID=2984950 RepID=UPI0022643A0B|nr:hypothetical protein [Streptomyces sp. PR69]